MIEQYVKQLSEELALPELPIKNEHKEFRLAINPTLSIGIKEMDPGYFLSAPLGACPQQKKEDLFILLMKANFLGQGTGGSVISLDAEEKLLTLSLRLPYEMNYKKFKEAVEDFANFVDYWREALVSHKTDAAQTIL